MKVLVIFALLALTTIADRHKEIVLGNIEPTEHDYLSLYERFKSDYKYKDHFIYEKYPNVDRTKLFRDNIDKFRAHNSNPSSLWKMGINKFADVTDSEFKEWVNI